MQTQKISIGLAQAADIDDYATINFEIILSNPDIQGISTTTLQLLTTQSKAIFAEDIIGNNRFVLLARDATIPTGVLFAITSDRTIWYLQLLYVVPRYRKKETGLHISDQLVQFCVDEITRRNGSKIVLCVDSASHHAIRLYARFGFKQLVDMERSSPPNNNMPTLIVMEKYLQAK